MHSLQFFNPMQLSIHPPNIIKPHPTLFLLILPFDRKHIYNGEQNQLNLIMLCVSPSYCDTDNRGSCFLLVHYIQQHYESSPIKNRTFNPADKHILVVVLPMHRMNVSECYLHIPYCCNDAVSPKLMKTMTMLRQPHRQDAHNGENKMSKRNF